jgi:hypothetical protein
MSKKAVMLETVFSDDGLIVRGSGALIDGVSVRRSKVLPHERGWLGEIIRADGRWFENFGYDEPGELCVGPQDNDAPCDWTRKDG